MKLSAMILALLFLTTLILCSCRGGGESAAYSSSALNDDSRVPIEQLQLPEVPATLTDTCQQAEYLVDHFWDNLDFSDTLRSHNRAFMEQNFANYVSIFSHVEREKLLRPVTRFIISSEADEKAFRTVVAVAEKFLYEPGSPMFNEENYELFLPAIISSKLLDKPTRERYMYQQDCINKNRRGSIAADFAYSDAGGQRRTLWTTQAADRLLLLFFDPECEHCREILAQLEASSELNSMVNNGDLSVMAICAENLSQWPAVKNSFPSNWIVGCDSSGIDDKRIYVLRGNPSIYLLDAEKRVVLKDVGVDKALAFLLHCSDALRQV